MAKEKARIWKFGGQAEMPGGNASPQIERAEMPEGGTSKAWDTYGWPAVIR